MTEGRLVYARLWNGLVVEAALPEFPSGHRRPARCAALEPFARGGPGERVS